MSGKLFGRIVVLIVLLFILVVIGVYNQHPAKLSIPYILPKGLSMPSAVMYFLFLAIGMLCGAYIATGKKGSGGSSKGD